MPLNQESEQGDGSTRAAQQSSVGLPLYEALRDYRNRDRASPLASKKAESRLFGVLSRWATSMAKRDGLQSHEADEVAALFVDVIFRNVAQCQALDHSEPNRAVAGTVTWTRKVYQSRLADWRREKKRHARLVLAGDELGGMGSAEADSSEQQVAEQAEREEQQVRRHAADKARAAVRLLIQTQQPGQLHQEAKRLGVGLTLEMLNLQIQVFERVRFNGEATYDVGVSLNQRGKRKQVQDRVSKWVERGRSALLLGVRLALEQQQEAAVREELDKLARSLAQPMKNGRKS
jgi:hypothetical protein